MRANVSKVKVGEKYITNEGYEVEITEYFTSTNITVQFKEGLILKNLYYQNVKKGEIKNPNHKSVFEIGYFGIGESVTRKNYKPTKSYNIWTSMLQRCYDKKSLIKNPTYKDCSVDKRWHNFQVFAEWFEKNYVDGFSLDKDILVKGNKLYSPETCYFVPKEINTLFTKGNKTRGKYYIGVHKHREKFQSCLSKNGKNRPLGTFNTPEEAFEAYKKAKENQIKKMAVEYYSVGKISLEIYKAMCNYNVEITD